MPNSELCSVAPQGVRIKVPLSISNVKLKVLQSIAPSLTPRLSAMSRSGWIDCKLAIHYASRGVQTKDFKLKSVRLHISFESVLVHIWKAVLKRTNHGDTSLIHF